MITSARPSRFVACLANASSAVLADATDHHVSAITAAHHSSPVGAKPTAIARGTVPTRLDSCHSRMDSQKVLPRSVGNGRALDLWIGITDDGNNVGRTSSRGSANTARYRKVCSSFTTAITHPASIRRISMSERIQTTCTTDRVATEVDAALTSTPPNSQRLRSTRFGHAEMLVSHCTSSLRIIRSHLRQWVSLVGVRRGAGSLSAASHFSKSGR